jgi:hypothetical protein
MNSSAVCLNGFCKQNWTNLATVSYTAYAASPGQLLSEKLWTVSATLSAQECKIKDNENDMNPNFKFQKLISAQTLESETKLHPNTE